MRHLIYIKIKGNELLAAIRSTDGLNEKLFGTSGDNGLFVETDITHGRWNNDKSTVVLKTTPQDERAVTFIPEIVKDDEGSYRKAFGDYKRRPPESLANQSPLEVIQGIAGKYRFTILTTMTHKQLAVEYENDEYQPTDIGTGIY